MAVASDKVFAGSIPEVYDSLLVPLIFEPYAADLGRRLTSRRPSSVLEVAAGTGVVTRVLAKTLPASTRIVASDLNPAMLERARKVGIARAIEWREADAMQLPFPDASFDAIVCQFGAMFFPDKANAFAETRRVLKPGGLYLFNVWDRIEDNEFADAVTESLKTLFPADPPLFLRRTPHGYCDKAIIERDLAKGGFAAKAQVETIPARSRAASAQIPAAAFCQGTPLRNDIVARVPASLVAATDTAAAAIARRFGGGAVDGKIQAHVIAVER